MVVEPSTSKRLNELRDQIEDHFDQDGVDLGVSSDEYDERSSSSSQSDGEYSSSSDGSLNDSSSDYSSHDRNNAMDREYLEAPENDVMQENPVTQAEDSDHDELDPNDPRVKRLLNKLMEDEHNSQKNVKGNEGLRRGKSMGR